MNRMMTKQEKIDQLKQAIEIKKENIFMVYGTTKDGSLGLAYHTEVVPLEKELKALENEVH